MTDKDTVHSEVIASEECRIVQVMKKDSNYNGAYSSYPIRIRYVLTLTKPPEVVEIRMTVEELDKIHAWVHSK